MSAAAHGNLAAMEVLLKAGALPDKGKSDDDVKPLYIAAQEGEAKCAKMLIDANAGGFGCHPPRIPLLLPPSTYHFVCSKLAASLERILPQTAATSAAFVCRIAGFVSTRMQRAYCAQHHRFDAHLPICTSKWHANGTLI